MNLDWERRRPRRPDVRARGSWLQHAPNRLEFEAPDPIFGISHSHLRESQDPDSNGLIDAPDSVAIDCDFDPALARRVHRGFSWKN